MRPGASIFRLVIAAVVMAVLACACRDSKIDRDLCAIEELTDLHADSAKELLESGEFDHLTDSFQLAHRALSEVAIEYKLDDVNYDYVNDSLIRVCRKYFENSKDLNHRMRFHYYAGLCAYDTSNCGAAITHFLTVLECADQLNSPYWKGLGNRYIANVYRWNYNFPQTIRYAERALKYFKENDSLTNNSTWKYSTYMRWQLASAYTGIGEYDKSIALCEEGVKIAKDSDYNELLWDCLSLLGTAHYRKKDYAEAARIYEQVCSIEDPELLVHSFLGLSYYFNGDIDKAVEIYKKHPFNKKDIAYLHLNYLIKTRSGNSDETIKAFELYRLAEDSDYNRNVSRLYDVPGIDLYEAKNELAKTQLSNQKFRNYVLIAAIVILLIAGSLIFYLYYSKNKRKIAEYSNLATEIRRQLESETENRLATEKKYIDEQTRSSSLMNQFNEASVLNDSLKKRIEENESTYNDKIKILSKVLKDKYDVFVDVCTCISKDQDEKENMKKLNGVINDIKLRFRNEPDYLDDLEQSIDITNDNLMKNFRSEISNLDELDYKIYLLTVSGINTTLISEFTEKNITTIYNRRRKIKTAIKDSNLGEEKIEYYLSNFNA